MTHLEHLWRGGLPVFVALALCGCAKAPEPALTVSYYRAHAEERHAMVERCAEDPGTLGGKPNCVNATRAAALEDIGSFSKLPPMGLTPTRPAPKDPDDARARVRPD